MKITGYALEHYAKGHSCCQAVEVAAALELGLDRETAFAAGAVMGGGICGSGGICGAVSGMMMSAGMLTHKLGLERDQRYAAAQKLQDHFLEEFGSLDCRDLLPRVKTDGVLNPSATCPAYLTKEQFEERPCLAYVYRAAQLLEEWSQELEQEK